MSQKSHLFFAALVSSMLLVACDSGASETTLNNQPLLEMTQIDSSEETESEAILVDKRDTSLEEVEQEEIASSQEIEELEKVNSETVVEETETADNSGAESLSTVENNPLLQVALQKLIDVTDLDKEGYSFAFEQTDEYIQLEVREKHEDVAPLEGIYRYMIETDQILFSDYLTGDFVPYN